jgi:glucose/arabinose dehydrogenase
MSATARAALRVAGSAAVLAVACTLGGTAALAGSTTASDSRPVDAAPPKVRLRHLADVDHGTAIASRASDTHVYVAEQGGRVLAIDGDEVAAEPVLDLEERTKAASEQGLLGLAFSPDGNHLYVNFTNLAGDTRVEEYAVTNTPGKPAKAETASRRVLLKVEQPQVNHNGGQLAFGADGNLYLGLGDGGNSGDEGPGHARGGNGQSTHTLLGKIVRVDLGGSGGEICDRGLRNPWRFSFDRDTGDLWIGDVGQDEWEEIDHLPATGICGNNLGWNVMEGNTRYRDGAITGDDPLVAPVAVLSHDDGYCALIGGFVYRGTQIPGLQGWYTFSDNCEGKIHALRVDADGHVQQRTIGPELSQVSSFGQDAAGELSVLSLDRGLYRITAR